MKLSQFQKGLIASILIPLLFQIQYLANATKPLSQLHNDAYLVNFLLKHYMNIFTSGNFNNLTTLPMFYGFGNSLFFSDLNLTQAILALPIFTLTRNIILTSNLLSILTIILSFTSMYLLAYYFTKKAVPSLIAGAIFTLNPFVFARYPDQLILISLQFIPLIFLFLEKSLRQPNSKNVLLLSVFLSLQLISSLYYSVFLTIILPIYLFFRMKQLQVHPRTFLSVLIIPGLALLTTTIFLCSYFYLQAYTNEPIERSLEDTSRLFSAWPTDYLFTSSFNLIYGGLKPLASQVAPSTIHSGIYSEHNLFMGIIPILILISSFWILRRSSQRALWILWLGLLFFSFLLSLGPQIHLTNSIEVPGPYLIFYKLNPLLHYLRTSARFGVFVFFFASLICAQTLTIVPKKRIGIISTILLLFIVAEYWNKPLTFLEVTPQTKDFYKVLENQQQIRVIVDLPIANQLPHQMPEFRAEELDAHYLLAATILHSKKLINGYSGFLPHEYGQRAIDLTLEFPTNPKLQDLKSWGADAIILHRDEFNTPGYYYQIKSGLVSLGLTPIESGTGLTLFDLTKWPKAR